MKASQFIADYFKTQNISFEVLAHEPFYTVEETLGEYDKMGIPENKSLFLRDEKKRRFFLIVIEGTKSADLKSLAERFGEKRLSFCSERFLESMLHTYPGAVSPLGLTFPEAQNIEVLVDQDLLDGDFVGFHPNENTATWKIKTDDFKKLLESCPQNIATEKL